ncbi:MAG: hypothetical protein C4520_20385 [Candidatus Abyssobacteria bacterium SURF_5]|uniref:Uncharacterized protein n=1 Tax=Abyssobacteria bacterium (strain SURF_5) TaxID=2093360 RepID=A0A3A4N9J0_ABYX5|nr:MAG: hypothetical protein C4520_20385 [Candidatus Abyssubacteria bacterium SURF_5]
MPKLSHAKAKPEHERGISKIFRLSILLTMSFDFPGRPIYIVESLLSKTFKDDILSEKTMVSRVIGSNSFGGQFESVFVFLIREQGRLRIEHDLHRGGLFSLETWRNLLRETGFELHEQIRRIGDQELPIFICLKPEDEK